MQRALLLTLLAAMALVVAGCSGGLEKAIIGKYSVNLDTSKMKAEDQAAVKMVEGFMKGISLEIKEGGKCEMKAMNDTTSGTWKLSGTKLTITEDKNKKAEVFEVSDGGKTLIPDPKSLGMGDMKGAVMTFKKQ